MHAIPVAYTRHQGSWAARHSAGPAICALANRSTSGSTASCAIPTSRWSRTRTAWLATTRSWPLIIASSPSSIRSGLAGPEFRTGPTCAAPGEGGARAIRFRRTLPSPSPQAFACHGSDCEHRDPMTGQRREGSWHHVAVHRFIDDDLQRGASHERIGEDAQRGRTRDRALFRGGGAVGARRGRSAGPAHPDSTSAQQVRRSIPSSRQRRREAGWRARQGSPGESTRAAQGRDLRSCVGQGQHCARQGSSAIRRGAEGGALGGRADGPVQRRRAVRSTC